MAEDTFYLTVAAHPNDEGKLLAVMTLGQPQMGNEHCIVLTLETVSSKEEAVLWYERMKVEQPWVKRS